MQLVIWKKRGDITPRASFPTKRESCVENMRDSRCKKRETRFAKNVSLVL